jgi:hypothetical protein
MKVCCKCKNTKELSDFGKLKSSKDGLRYDCNTCRKEYRVANKKHIDEKNKAYFEKNKETVLMKNKEYRESNKSEISIQRQQYRELNKEHIKQKQKEYLPVRKEAIKERRRKDDNFRLSEIVRSKIHRMIKGQSTSYTELMGCDIQWLRKWLEFQFDENMNWSNIGTYWHIDHILAINLFDFSKDSNKRVCFNWTNLQPLKKKENQSKSDKLVLHYYFNSIVTIHRFCQINNTNLGYQRINESRCWLREKLR